MKYLACALLLGSTVFAQNLPKPVPARAEKFHKVVFENDYVCVIDVQYGPGETTDFHIHTAPSVVVYLTKSNNRSETWGETGLLLRETTPGDSRFAPYDQKPLSHRVTNTGTTHFRVFDIELLRKAPAPAAVAVARPAGTEAKWDEKLVRSSTLRLEPGARVEVPATACAHLLIGIAGATTTPKRALQNGDFEYYPPNTRFEARNSGREKSEAVLLELR